MDEWDEECPCGGLCKLGNDIRQVNGMHKTGWLACPAISENAFEALHVFVTCRVFTGDDLNKVLAFRNLYPFKTDKTAIIIHLLYKGPSYCNTQ